MIPESIHRKIGRCLALAQDPRGDRTTAETALRQAAALMRKHGIDPKTGQPVKPENVDWSKRTSAEAAAAGLRKATLCADGWFVP